MRDKVIRINWCDRMLLEDAIKSDLAKEQGLYYITRVFGKKETSLYLGIARYNNTISHRLKAHQKYWLKDYRGKIYVRIGSIIYPKTKDKKVLADIIDHAESAILFDEKHKDLFVENKNKKNSYSYSNLYRIENQGDIYELNPTIMM